MIPGLTCLAQRLSVRSAYVADAWMCSICKSLRAALPPMLAAILAMAAGLCIVPASIRADEPPADATPNNSWQSAANSDLAHKRLAEFLTQYCYDCHASDEPAGERRLDALPGTIEDDNALIDYQDILDQLNLGEMPPADSLLPPNEKRREIIEQLTERIRQYHASHKPQRGEVILRRLNSREYRNVIRDLLHLDMSMFDPTEKFPRDQQSEHLDNLGDSLVTSGHLLARYLEAAEKVVDKALYPLQRPEVQTWRFDDDLDQQPEIDQVHRKTNQFQYLTLYDVVGADKHEGAYAPIHAFAQGVPHDGYYEISFKAQAVNREHPYDDSFLGTDRREPLKLGIVAGTRSAGPLHQPQPIEPLLAEFDLADEPDRYSVRIWLDAGFTPRFTFRNGLMDARNLWSRVQKKYPDLFPEAGNGIVAQRYNAIANGKLPQIHVDEIEIRGPLFDAWPTASQREILGDDWERVADGQVLGEESMRRNLNRFMSRAYRRPVSSQEVQRVMGVIRLRLEQGRSELEAFSDGIKTVLCSPNFIYWNDGNSETVSAWSLASRLSSFLWSSMPDDQLLRLAASRQLLQPDVLKAEVHRMLDSDKSDAFIHDFLDAWLTLRDLGTSPPDRNLFSQYYHYDLGTAMRRETQYFTRHILDENLPITNFLDSDFTFINKRLAWHYGLEVPDAIVNDASKFIRIDLPDNRRGGLLGHASVLTVTANGIDTSPVVRGVWLLENILGTPPNPPPPDVEPLDPDVRGATTIRDQLEKHRSTPSCYDCHRKIDPLGFALENYDAIGAWRDQYHAQAPVDSAGELPNGRAFESIRELKPILLEQRELFARSLTEKLVAYALGREIEIGDRPDIDAITAQLAEDDYGFRSLMELVVLSPLFLSQ